MTIAEALIKLATDPALLEKFKKDKDRRSALLEELGLTADQAKVLLGGDLRKIRYRIDVEWEVGGEEFVMRVVHWPAPPLPPPPGPIQVYQAGD
jgi:hypothetical protein